MDLPTAGATIGQRFRVAGWSHETWGTPIEAIHVWALPVGGGAPRFLGVPDVVVDRPDVADLFGTDFLRSGFGLRVSDLPPGTWDIVVFIWPTGGTGFTDVRVVRVTVP